jgi:RHS repeat-associated protein
VNLVATSPAGSGATIAVNPYAPDAGNDTPVIVTASYNDNVSQFQNFTSIVRINGGGILGFPPFSTQNGGPFDFIDPATDVVNVSIPIRHKTGKIPFDYSLVSSTSDYVINFNGNLYQWISSTSFRGVSNMDVRLSYTTGNCTGHPAPKYFNFKVIDAYGTAHPLVPAITLSPATSCSYYQKSAFTSNDDSGYYAYIDVTSETPVYTLMDRSGNSYSMPDSFGGMKMTDPNGVTMIKAVTSQPPYTNFTTTYTDSLGQVALIANTTSGGPTPWTYQYFDASGTTKQSYTLTFGSNQKAATNFQCSINGQGIIEMPPTPVYLPISLSVPGGGSYSFAYEPTYQDPPYTTERLAQITLPTGGYTTYTYGGTANDGSNHGINCTDEVTVPTVTRTVVDTTAVGGSGSGVWTYKNPAGINTTNLSETVGVTLPDNTTETYQFSNLFKTSKTTGSSILEIVCYNGTALANCRVPPSGFGVTYPINEMTTYTSLDSSSNKETDIFFESHGLPTEIDRYDFGPIKVSVEKIAYGSETSTWNCDNSKMAPNNIFDRVCYDAILQSDGKTTVNYKAASYDTSGKGNKVSSRVWTGGTNFLTTSFVNNSNGTVATITEPNTAKTTLGYACNGLLLTSTGYANGLSSSQTWDCNGGVVKDKTEISGSAVHYDYGYGEFSPDPLWRVKEYTDEASNDTTFTYGVTSSENNLTFGSSTNDILTTLDSLGRKILVQKQQGPSATQYDTVRTTYDAVGRVSTVSVPFSCGLGCTTVPTAVTRQTYDSAGRPFVTTDPNNGTITKTYVQNTVISALGPTTPTVTRQLQYDGLGRLTSVCEVSAQNGNGACGQHTSPNGFVTSYYYREDGVLLQSTQGAQTRIFTYDNAGRMSSETNPESGTTAYYYDSDATNCGNSSPGDLASLRVNKTNITCFWYDSLHRLIQRTATDGISTNSNFTWDSATVNGHSVGQKGKIAEAWTCPYSSKLCAGAHQTDESFQYDARGNVTGYFQQSPNSGGMYSVTAGYDALNQLSSLSLPSIPTISIGSYDGEGRPTSILASSGQNPVYNGGSAAVFYGPLGIGSVTYGSGDSDTWSYDAAGHINNIKTAVGSAGQYYQSNVTWNASGTVKQLWTTDTVTGGTHNNVTDAYRYDDMGRVSTAAGGTTMAETYTYDRYGNITTSGSPSSWAPGYDATTNRFTATNCNPGGICYDADGNLLTDPSHAYTWDGEDKLVSIDGYAIIRDAFGRKVEESCSSGCTAFQTLYAPVIGKVALAIGQTIYTGRIPLPGGGNAVYNWTSGSEGLDHYSHPDWLGNARIQTTPAGDLWAQREYTPFGVAYDGTACPTGCDLLFNGGSQDTASSEYDTENRALHSVQGRWIQPDPAGLSAVDPSNPQTWNRYAYVLNNPLSAVDPSGLDCIYDNGDGTADVYSGDCLSPTDNGFYVDGTVGQDSQLILDRSTGDLQLGYTDTNGNYGTTYIQGFADPLTSNGDQLSAFAQGVLTQPVLQFARNTVNNYIAPPLLTFLGFAVPGALSAGGPETTIGGAVVIGKMSDLENAVQPGENPLDLPDQGNPRANWAQNSSRLRQAMSEGRPIRDASAGNPEGNTGFLKAERNLLESHGWTLQGEYWVPPSH